ncbi:MAG: SDR family oxidoreductase [Leptospirales bacterium]|jgi:NAD(P)-dependent dehydrogenase (short-subunit alcohol dehydrogenase family)
MKTIVITGASSGIGFGLARACLERGYNVVANARTAERLAEAARQLGEPAAFEAVAGDIGLKSTAESIVARGVERFGGIDLLVNNAGIFNAKAFVDYDTDDLDGLIDTNLKGFFFVSQKASEQMLKQGHGHIINVTATIAMQPNASVPAALPILIKGGLNQVTRALALEYATKNIRVNAVAPGIIDTPLYTSDMHEFLNTLQPVGKIGRVEDIVNAVLYLAEADFTTGVVLPVDGGMTAGKW